MTEVYWLEQNETEVPAGNDWLSADEAASLGGLRFAKRRTDWRLGRWAAKRALAVYFELPGHPRALADIRIRPAPSGAPEVLIANQPAAVSISISHRGGIAVCAVTASGVALGCDLEMVEPRSATFVADYFTAEERAIVAHRSAAERPVILALLWSAKESALKVLRTGLRLDTRSLIVSLLDTQHSGEFLKETAFAVFDSWRPLRVGYLDRGVFHGWWQRTDRMVRTVVASPPQVQPIFLRLSSKEKPRHQEVKNETPIFSS